MKPIIFNAEMVRAILDGRKSQTRRMLKIQPPSKWDRIKKILNHSFCFYSSEDEYDYGYLSQKCPFGEVGDRLWVRETFAWVETGAGCGELIYKANNSHSDKSLMWWNGKYRPSIHMPKEFSRITLEITDVRVERVKDIGLKDLLEEGLWRNIVKGKEIAKCNYSEDACYRYSLSMFKDLWNSIYKGSWDRNDWCWCVSFKRLN